MIAEETGQRRTSLPLATSNLQLETLEPKKIKAPAIVVNSVTAEFTPNAPDLAKRIPPPPAPQFEVAVLKLSPPDAQNPRAQLQQTGVANTA